MSPLSKTNVISALQSALIAWLLSAGLSLTASAAIFEAIPVLPLVLLTGGLSIFLCLIKLIVKKSMFFAAAALAVLAALGFIGFGPVAPVVQAAKAAYLSAIGVSGALLPYRSAVIYTLAFLLSLLSVSLSGDTDLLSSMIVSLLVLLPCFMLSIRPLSVIYALPAALALLLILAKEHTGELAVSAVAVGAALAVIALLLTPALPKTNDYLAEKAQQLRQTIEDYLFFNQSRTGFTLETEGYLPLSDRLGGKAEPETHAVMDVETEDVLRLRAVAYNNYDGFMWRDTLSTQRRLWISAYYEELKSKIFDMKLPADSQVAEKRAAVRLVRNGSTTLYAPQRLRELAPASDRMVTYFNDGSEVFITRPLVAGDYYAFSYLPFMAGDQATEALILEGQGAADPRYSEVASTYLQLPAHTQSEIYAIAETAAGNAQTPYEKALAIENYLASNFAYTLNVDTPPDNADFVAWFLLREKKGYCTYFASAMTLLCRIAGIPARYVTGFLAVPDESGVAHVTGEDAHAWTEIYLNGFGWLPMDATPKRQTEREQNSGEKPPEQSGGDQAPTPSPEPSPSPSPSPSPESEEEPAATPTLEPENAPSVSPNETPEPEAPPVSPPPPDRPFPWIWLLIILAAAAVILRIVMTEPVRRAARRPEDALAILGGALLSVLAQSGCERKAGETLSDFAVRIAAGFTPVPLEWLAADYSAALYGRKPVDPSPFAEAYRTLYQRLNPLQKLRLTLSRAFTFHRKRKI